MTDKKIVYHVQPKPNGTFQDKINGLLALQAVYQRAILALIDGATVTKIDDEEIFIDLSAPVSEGTQLLRKTTTRNGKPGVLFKVKRPS